MLQTHSLSYDREMDIIEKRQKRKAGAKFEDIM